MMKRLFVPLILLTSTIVIAGCGHQAADLPATPPAPSSAPKPGGGPPPIVQQYVNQSQQQSQGQ